MTKRRVRRLKLCSSRIDITVLKSAIELKYSGDRALILKGTSVAEQRRKICDLRKDITGRSPCYHSIAKVGRQSENTSVSWVGKACAGTSHEFLLTGFVW